MIILAVGFDKDNKKKKYIEYPYNDKSKRTKRGDKKAYYNKKTLK
jgi:hypothetical protein